MTRRAWRRAVVGGALIAALTLGSSAAWATDAPAAAPPTGGSVATLDEDTAVALDRVFLRSDRWHNAGLLSLPGTVLGVAGLVVTLGGYGDIGEELRLGLAIGSGGLVLASSVAYTGNGLAQGLLAQEAARLTETWTTQADVALVGGIAGVFTGGTVVGWIAGRRAIQKIRRDLGFADGSLRLAPRANGVALVGRF